MADILEIINTTQVRSLLGVSDEDLSESEFDPDNVELELKMSLDEDAIDYDTIKAVSEGTPTVDELKQYNYLKLYCLYAATIIVIPRLRLAATQKVSDGDNSMERFLDPKFDVLEGKYESKKAQYKRALEDTIAGSPTSDAPTYSQFGSAPPAYDPVTGS